MAEAIGPPWIFPRWWSRRWWSTRGRRAPVLSACRRVRSGL